MQKSIKAEYYPAAIEIGTSSLKLLQMAKTPDGFKIAKCGYFPLASSSTIRETLKRLIQEQKIKGEVVGGLPINKFQTLTYILPNMPEGEIEQAVAWKLKQNPAAGTTFEDISFDYVPVSTRVIPEMRVLVFAASKSVVLEQIKLFQELSLKLSAVEPKPYSVLNALVWLEKFRPDETVLVLQIGATQSSLMIVHSGQPYLLKALAISGNTFTEAIANYYQFDWQKAEGLKKQEGLKGLEPALSSRLENLLVELEHTFKYFSHQIMRAEITAFDRILLCGGGSVLNNLAQFLSSRLEVPVDCLNPLSSLNLCLGQELPALVKENEASFASVLGQAIRYIE